MNTTFLETTQEIAEILALNEREREELDQISGIYPVRVTPYYLNLIDPEDPDDPIRKMCIPKGMEMNPEGLEDTSGEYDNTVLKGMQHKYRQTTLILSTNQCAMYCRHCFRKRMVGSSGRELASHIPEMAEYVRNHPEVNNVLISGGDSFMNSNDVITQYLEAFTAIDHLDFIRFGTRTPVVLPTRITDDPELARILREYGRKKQIIIVTHYNHPKELTEKSLEAIRILQDSGCLIRNQTVFLRGINDDPQILATLMNQLVSVGIIPYYLFQCRPVKGAKGQFQIPILEGFRIFSEARKYMNGMAKSVRYAMSHYRGKIEIVGPISEKKMLFTYHQAKYPEDHDKVFTVELKPDQTWLDL